MADVSSRVCFDGCHVVTATKIIGLLKCADTASLCWWMVSNGKSGWLIWIVVAIGVMYLLYLGIKNDRPAYLVPFLAKMCITAASFVIGGMFMFVSPFEDERHEYGPMTRVVAVVVIAWGVAHIWFFKIVYKCFEHLKWKRAHEGIQVIP